jgi:hypothetical protein
MDSGQNAHFSFDDYKKIINEYDLLTTKRGRLIFANKGVPTELSQQLFYKLPAEYRSKLPNYLLACCPICGAKVKEPVDTYSLRGIGWHYNGPTGFGWFGRQPKHAGGVGRLSAFPRLPMPSYQTNCSHVKAVMYGVNFNGILPDDVARRHVETGSERPGVLKSFIAQDRCYAVVHSLPVGRFDDAEWQPRYTVYFVTCFSEDYLAYSRALAPQKSTDQDFCWPYDRMDYDLVPWVEAGKLFWLDPQDPTLPLCGNSVDTFPYGHVVGLEGRWRISKRRLELMPLDWGGWHLAERLPRNKQRLALQKAALQERALRKLDRR